MKRIQFLFISLLLALSMPAMAQNTLVGDVNGDGVVNISDLNAVISIILDGKDFTEAADVNGDGNVNISDVNAVISIILDGPPTPHQHDYVDLGLPSGTLWATRNVGATTPEEYGDYFAWGETDPKEVYTWETYKWCREYDGDFVTKLKKYNLDFRYGAIDHKIELDPEDDAAYVNCGSMWRMPTLEQIKELNACCSWQWTTTDSGVNGQLVTGPNGNTIFLPAAGGCSDSVYWAGSDAYYWSRTLCSRDKLDFENEGEDSGEAYIHRFYASRWYVWYDMRCVGLPVRPVRVPVYIEQQSIDFGEVPVGRTRTAALTIVNNARDSVTLTATADAPFSFEEQENSVSSITVVVPGNSRKTVTVMFKATTPGDFNGNVTIDYEALHGTQTVIPVHASAFVPRYEYVDLGLSSGTLWATMNVGAIYPEEYGDYFAWGETSPKRNYTWESYKWCNGSQTSLTKYCTDSLSGMVDAKTELEPEDDAAYVNWGTSWRMPTLEQQQELMSDCSWKWTTSKDVKGYQVTGPNGNSIFLPAAGYRNIDDSSPIFVGSYGDYWSRTLNAYHPDYARDQYFFSSGAHWGVSSRNLGFTVRPVYERDGVYIKQRSLDLGEVPVGETRVGELTIVNNTTESVILTATVQEPFLFKQEDGNASTMTIEVPVGSCKLSVMYTAAAPVTHIERRVTFQGSALEGGQCVIPVSAVVIYTPEYVDLGLPSGTLWATRNIGANSPEDSGDHFAWGETDPKEVYNWSTYKWCNGSSNTMTKYCTNSSYGTVDGKSMLDPEDDAAYVNWGPEWRMPTDAQQNELLDYCTWNTATRNGVNGVLLTGPNGNTLFLPPAGDYGSSLHDLGTKGCYWSCSLTNASSAQGGDTVANHLYFSWGDVDWEYAAAYYYRCRGHSVRAVRASQQ